MRKVGRHFEEEPAADAAAVAGSAFDEGGCWARGAVGCSPNSRLGAVRDAPVTVAAGADAAGGGSGRDPPLPANLRAIVFTVPARTSIAGPFAGALLEETATSAEGAVGALAVASFTLLVVLGCRPLVAAAAGFANAPLLSAVDDSGEETVLVSLSAGRKSGGDSALRVLLLTDWVATAAAVAAPRGASPPHKSSANFNATVCGTTRFSRRTLAWSGAPEANGIWTTYRWVSSSYDSILPHSPLKAMICVKPWSNARFPTILSSRRPPEDGVDVGADAAGVVLEVSKIASELLGVACA